MIWSTQIESIFPYKKFFFFNDTATTEIYTLSLHDALPISTQAQGREEARGARGPAGACEGQQTPDGAAPAADRKSTRLNSSHANISYAVFCLKKKKTELHSRQSFV